MDADLEHVAYRYRPPASLKAGQRWHYDDADAPMIEEQMIELADKGWQVERLYRKEGDDGS